MTNSNPIPGVWPEVHAALERLTKPYPAQAIALADAHREEVAPHLVAELHRLAADPSQAADDENYMLHLYAMFLLAWWRDPRGLQPLLALAHTWDSDLLDLLLGDHLFNGLGRCLGSMARGDLPPLLALADDRQADPWARSAALEAMLVRMLEGDVPRETVLAHWRDLGEREAAACRADGSESDFLTSVIIHATDLGASDLLPAIRGWFDEGLPNQDLIRLRSVEEEISLPPEQSLQQLRERGNKGYIGTPEKEIAWWYCFKEKPDRSAFDLKATVPPPRERAAAFGPPPPPVQPHVRESPKLGRNDPCHCGSGKKFKKCHGAG